VKQSLEEYFNKLKYYDFFDELFYYEKNNKDDIISKSGINYSSYRVLKARNLIDDNTIAKLSAYFKTNIIDLSKQRECLLSLIVELVFHLD